ncbi:MAG: hypothetical protein IJ503_08620, partial [Akkermansia sp.]|nr:hypothetical protein [Akkermansia sp.]
SVSLSSFGLHRVGVPRSIHESSPHVKLIFQKFCIFLQQFFKNIEKSMFFNNNFFHFFHFFQKAHKNPLQTPEWGVCRG